MHDGLRRITVLLMLLATTVSAEEQPIIIEVGSYYKNLFIKSETLELFPPVDSYLLGRNRLRLKLESRLSDRVSFNLQYDNEILLGNYLDTTQFAALKALEPDTYLDLEHTYTDNPDLFSSHRLYRAYATLSFTAADLRIGR